MRLSSIGKLALSAQRINAGQRLSAQSAVLAVPMPLVMRALGEQPRVHGQ